MTNYIEDIINRELNREGAHLEPDSLRSRVRRANRISRTEALKVIEEYKLELLSHNPDPCIPAKD